MGEIDIASLERLAKGSTVLLNKLAEARRSIIFLRDRLHAAGELNPASIAYLERADEVYRTSIETVRNTGFLQADTVAKLKSLVGDDEQP
ncbi:conserved hypothetical protein [Candidatus Terasakiella magnetica]|nr:conserved hypothetical protein [Candidatus Terasakiella magnetica]